MKNLKTYTINLSNIKLVTNKLLCLSLLPSGIPLMAAQKSRYTILRSQFWVVIPIFQNQAVFIFPQNVFSLFFGENVGCKKVVFWKSKAILYFISSESATDLNFVLWHCTLLAEQVLNHGEFPTVSREIMGCNILAQETSSLTLYQF